MSTDQQDWTVLAMLKWATAYFKEQDIPDPRHSIEWLLADTLGVKRLDLYLSFDRPLAPAELERLRPLVKRRARHEPLQYITGFSDFMNARLEVNPDVLIPRIETEQLVEIILDNHPAGQQLEVLDIGTGSGCIPIALKMERPEWKVSALDISERALVLARSNAGHNEAEVDFRKGDVNQPDQLPFEGPFDLLVSNPPYVHPDEREALEPQVKNHEPATALFCEDLEAMYRNIIRCGSRYLQQDGYLYLEINERHPDTILALFDKKRWEPTLQKDYDKKARFITARRLQ